MKTTQIPFLLALMLGLLLPAFDASSFYDPSQGRWVNRDPMGESGGLNLYGFTGGDPVNKVDPSGEIAFVPVLVGIGIGIAVDWIYDEYLDPHVQDYIDENFDCETQANLRTAGSVINVARSIKNPARLGIKGAKKAAANARPPNLSPPGAGRTGALRQSLRQNGVPTSQQPDRVFRNADRRGNSSPGRVYEYDVPASGGGTRTVRIRDDAGGHHHGVGNPQNRGPHFNDESGNHYDY
jgi:uncharacterized protein RhaS with RHS repeats